MLALAASLAAGCAVRGNVDMLESELRRQEAVQEDLTDQIKVAREELRVARTDADSLRAQLAGRGGAALVAEQADVLYRAEALQFGALLSGGFNRDGLPGDEGISALLLPVDSGGDLVKLAGTVELELFDMSLDADRQRLGRWQFSAEEVREHWHKGFMSAGYLFRLDWQQPPASSELTVHARLTAPDGRQFDATKQVKVVPPGTNPDAPQVASKTGRPQRAAAPVAPASFEAHKPARQELPKPDALPRVDAPAADRPGHAPIRTSDKWTGDTIPTLR